MTHLEADPGLAEEVLRGHRAVLEDDVAGGGCPDAQLVLLLAEGEALRRHRDVEGADPLVLHAAICRGKDDRPLRLVSICYL